MKKNFFYLSIFFGIAFFLLGGVVVLPNPPFKVNEVHAWTAVGLAVAAALSGTITYFQNKK